MNRTSEDLNAPDENDPLMTVDPFASYDPELTNLLKTENGLSDETLDDGVSPIDGAVDATVESTAPSPDEREATLDGGVAPGVGQLDATLEGVQTPVSGGVDATLDGGVAPGVGDMDATLEGVQTPVGGDVDATLDGGVAPGVGDMDATLDGAQTPSRGGDVGATLDAGAPSAGGFDATIDGGGAPGVGGMDGTLDASDASTSGSVGGNPTPLSETLDDRARSQISEACIKFESAWEHGDQEPSVEAYVPKDLDPSARQSLVRQLVLVDIKYRKRNNKILSSVDYLSRLPECREAVESVFANQSKSNLPAGYGSVAIPRKGKSRKSRRPVHADDPTTRYPPSEFLARGGLGCVFHAQDAELNRLVALKEILPNHADNARLQEKFLFEAEVTGSLEHPGIVPVYGLGRYQDNQPYYAMRFIRGQSFQDVIEDFHRQHAPLTASTFYDRDFRSLLKRLIDACNAMHYAHVHGVLHRDIKPDNIMIGSFGETLVVDWGLAKLVEVKNDSGDNARKSSLSSLRKSGRVRNETGVSGTPMYMSPEQAGGLNERLDGRTDVYSLGAVLFYIVSANCAVTGKTARDVITNVRLGKTTTVEKVAPAAPKALASICRKAMALDPNDRYQSAVELGEDIDRWLSDEVVLAHVGHETLIERAGRLLRKHRGLTMSIAASLVIITIITFVAALLINGAKNRERIAKEQEQVAKEDAVARYRDSRDAIQTWLVQSSNALQNFPGTEDVRELLLNRAAKDYEKLALNNDSHDPQLELERGRARVELGELYERQLKFDTARERYNEALKLLEPIAGSEALAIQSRSECANVHAKLAVTYKNQGKTEEAKQEFATAIKELTELVDESEDPLPRRFLAATRYNVADLHISLGEDDLAIEHLEDGLKQYGSLNSESDGKRDLGIALIKEQLGRIYRERGEHVQAMTFFNEAIDSLRILVESEPDNLEYFDALASVYNSQASTFRTRGLEAQLFDSLQTAADSYRVLCTAMPNMPRYRANLGTILTNLGLVSHESGQNAKAEELLNEAYDILFDLDAKYGVLVPEYREKFGKCQDALAQVYLDTRDDPGELMQQAELTVIQQIQSAATNEQKILLFEELAIYEAHLARTLYRQDKADLAEPKFVQARKRLEQLIQLVGELPRYTNVLAHIHYRHALMLHERKDDRAAQNFQKARDLWKSIETKAASYAHDLAWLLSTCPDESFVDIASALSAADEAVQLAPNNPHYLATLALANVLDENADEALKLLDQSKAARGDWIDRDLFVLAMAQKLDEKPEEAKQSLADAIEWMEQNRPFNADMMRLRAVAESQLAK